MAVTLELSIFDLPSVKPKCVSAVVDFYQFSAVWIQFSIFNFLKNMLLLKPILVSTIYGLGCIIRKVLQLEIATFDLGHPVLQLQVNTYFKYWLIIFRYCHKNLAGEIHLK